MYSCQSRGRSRTFQGGGGGVDGTLELKNQWSMLPNCFSLRIITSFKAVTLQILAISQCRNYNEVTIQIVPLIFIIYFNFSTFFFFLLPQKGVSCHPIHPLPLNLPLIWPLPQLNYWWLHSRIYELTKNVQYNRSESKYFW